MTDESGISYPGPPPERPGRKFDCMFHDEGIPDAPCNCSDGLVRTGAHEIVRGEIEVDVPGEVPDL